ncbi:MAG: hypothetical protein WC277_07795 [Bacilli bacterium]|jgi:hypothetical protein
MRAITEDDFRHLEQVLTGQTKPPTDPVTWLNAIARPVQELIAAGQISLEAFR